MFPVIKALPVVDGAANWLLTYVSVKICPLASFPSVTDFQAGSF